MYIAAYLLTLFLVLARYNASILGSNCQKRDCPAGCIDVNNEACNSEDASICHCKSVIGRGLIVTGFDAENDTTGFVFSLPIAQDGTPSQRPLSNHFSIDVSYLSVDVDNILQQAYLYDSHTKTIQKNPNYYSGPSTKNIWTTLHQGVSGEFLKLAVDWISNNIYWTDNNFKWIMVMSLEANNTSLFRVLIHENLEGPHALTLDSMESLLFWSDIGKFPKIEVSSLSGRNRRTLVFSNLLYPCSLTADYEEQRLYFVDNFRQTVETVTYDGNDRKILLGKAFSNLLDLTVYQNYLYVADTNIQQLFLINKTNGNELINNIEGQFTCFGVAVFHHDIQPSSFTDHCLNYGCEQICLTEKNGAVCTCKDGYNLNQDMKTCSLKNKYFHRALVYSNESSICVVDIRILSDFVFDPVCVLETSGTQYMALDTDQRMIFIANDSAIYWTSVDDPEFHRLTGPAGQISGMAWDGYERNLYWTEADTGKIWRMSMESQDAEMFLDSLEKPRDIMILPTHGLVYWISGRNGSTIEFSRTDRGNHRDVHSDDNVNFKSLSYDQDKQRIYFLATSPDGGNSVSHFNHDGYDIQSFLVIDQEIEKLEIFKGYLLLTAKNFENTSIMSYSIEDKTRITAGVFIDSAHISDIKFFDENNRQKQKEPCFPFKGRCDQICIANGTLRICKCRFGFSLAEDGATCLSDPINDNFMLIGDILHQNIYQISLTDQTVKGIDVKGINPKYDPIHDRVIWRKAGGKYIYSMHLNGTEMKRYPIQRTVFLLDVDSTTGDIYYASTNEGECYISVKSENKWSIDLFTGLSNIYGLVVYPSEGYMFFLHNHSLVRSTMNGSQTDTILDSLQATGGMTIDYKNGRLYWIKQSDDYDGYDIESCKMDGSNRSTLFEFKESFLKAYVPTNLAVNEDIMFIAFNKQSRLIKLNISNPIEMTEVDVQGELGNIGDISIYSSAAHNRLPMTARL